MKILDVLINFIGPSQRAVLAGCLRGEERNHFKQILAALAKRIEEMPKSYENRRKDSLVYLHYFHGGYDWYILEKDAGSPTDSPLEQGKQSQAYGLARFPYEEIGYISIEELIKNNVELDLYWEPKPLKDCII